MYTPSPMYGRSLSKERQLMKWVGIFQVRIFQGGFSTGQFDEWEFYRGEFRRT